MKHIDIHPEDCTLNLESFHAALSERTRLVAVGYASNCVGTINPLQEIIRAAHNVGALVYIDAVHYAPHGPIDVVALDCDFLVCSAYKFFGPHVGILYGRRTLLESLTPCKLRPSPTTLPGKWLIGTQNHEGIAGVRAAVDYLADVGRQTASDATTRRERLLGAFEAIGVHERSMAQKLLAGVAALPAVMVWGITEPGRLSERVPTVSFTHERWTPREISTQLAERGLFVWDGNHYALPLTERLGLEPHGTLRVGLVHYNTTEEVDRLLEELGNIL